MKGAGFAMAVEDFRRARRRAALEQVLARLSGRSDELLSYEEVRRQVGARGEFDRGLQEIPLDAIVGSVGRYSDFTRTFLPRSDSIQDRWARVKALATDMSGWAPIEVYQLGDAYFVLDGNHRVSVAREMEMETIPAYVTEVKTRVPLAPGMEPDEIIIKARHADFLEQTGLDELRPDANLTVTAPGAYRTLLEHIDVHRYYMGIEQNREVSYPEAVAHWYDSVYLPVVAVIRDRGLLYDFPERTEADLYLWLAEHRAELEEELGWQVEPDVAAENLVSTRSPRRERLLTRIGERIWDAVTIDEFEPGPATGAWRTDRLAGRHDHRLFIDILVAVNGEESGWLALEQAITVANLEDASLRGLHIVPVADDVEDEEVQHLRDRFQWRMGEVNQPAKLVVEAGPIVTTLCDRVRWNDLLVLPLSHPPGKRPLQRINSGFRQVVQRCPRPILAVSQTVTPMQKALLAYDGSPKAEEALFVAAYAASNWQIPVVVVTVNDSEEEGQAILARSRAYFQELDLEAEYVVKAPPTAAALLAVSDQYDCDFLIMGGYGANPFVEAVMGSVLNDILRTSYKPVLICR